MLKSMQAVDNAKLREIVKRQGSITAIGRKCNISSVVMVALCNGKNTHASEKVVHKLEMGLKLSRREFLLPDETEYNPKQRKAPTDNAPGFIQDSEDVLMGLKRKIEARLSTTHSNGFIQEIMGTVDDIIIESSYFGVNCQKNGMDNMIYNAVKKRVANDSLTK